MGAMDIAVVKTYKQNFQKFVLLKILLINGV
jgi:hypothetical protein